MQRTVLAMITISAVMLAGCVSSGAHQRTLAELEETRETLAKTAAATARLEQERAAKEAEIQRLTQTQEDLTKSKEQVAAALTEARAQAQEETSRLQATLEQEKARLKAEEAEKVRLEQERAAKEAEIQRLTQTHADLTKSLQAEIAKGDIRIKQVRDRLTINMVDRVLFDSGQGQVKPAGLKVLKQVSDILKNVTDKQIRIEGHTDNVPIGGKLKSRFPSNWELSTARATSVVRYLIDEGGVDRANLSAVGYADMRPVASNATEEGRTANRRIEITLYPKDLSEIASQIKP
jgi:chemotaxis protein MotB